MSRGFILDSPSSRCNTLVYIYLLMLNLLFRNRTLSLRMVVNFAMVQIKHSQHEAA